MRYIDGKGTFFQWSWNDKRKFKKNKFKNDLMNLIETHHQINMTSDHSILIYDSFKIHLNA